MARTILYVVGAVVVVAIAFLAEDVVHSDAIPIKEVLFGVYALLPGLAKRNQDKRVVMIVRQKDFRLGRNRLILYGTLGTFACIQLGQFFAVLISDYLSGQILDHAEVQLYLEVGEAIGWVSLVAGLLLAVPLLLVTGRWIGGRTRLRESRLVGSVCVLLAYVLAGGIASLVLVLMDGTQDWESFMPFFGLYLLVATPVLFGYWVGRRHALGSYMAYLLTKVNEDSRGAIVDLVHEEANRRRATP